MSRKYKFGDSSELYFISFAVINWIDLFIRKEYKDIVLDSWRFCQQEKGLEIYGWCIMSSHVHMIVGTTGRPLEKTIGEMKSFTSRNLRKAIENNTGESRREWIMEMMKQAGLNNNNNNDWQLWQQHNQPIELRNPEIFHQKLQYIHDNPVEAGFVEKEEDYWYSSARDFNGRKGPLWCKRSHTYLVQASRLDPLKFPLVPSSLLSALVGVALEQRRMGHQQAR